MAIDDKLKGRVEELIKDNRKQMLPLLVEIVRSKKGIWYLKDDDIRNTDEYKILHLLADPEYDILFENPNGNKPYSTFIMTEEGRRIVNEIIIEENKRGIKTQPSEQP